MKLYDHLVDVVRVALTALLVYLMIMGLIRLKSL